MLKSKRLMKSQNKFLNKILTIVNHHNQDQKVLKKDLIVEIKVKIALLKREVFHQEVLVIEADHAPHLIVDKGINLDHLEEDFQGLHLAGIKTIDQDLQDLIKDQDLETKIADKTSLQINYLLTKSLN